MTHECGSWMRASRRLLLFLAFTLPLMPLQAVLLLLRLPLSRRLPQWYHRHLLRLLGIRIDRRGKPSATRPTLFVANHVSYWDIPVLGSLVPCSFVAKSEIAGWPLVSWLAKLQRSVFIERRGRDAGRHRDRLGERLEARDYLILFPEGTTSDGNRVLPFKSSLFAVAERRPADQPLLVQPVSIAYTRLDGTPMGHYLRPFVAWYGEMDLAAHAWNGLSLGQLTVAVEFHPPVTIADFASRKALSRHCRSVILEGVAAALAGHSRRERRQGETAPGTQPAADGAIAGELLAKNAPGAGAL